VVRDRIHHPPPTIPGSATGRGCSTFDRKTTAENYSKYKKI